MPKKSRTWRFNRQVLIYFVHEIFLIDQLFFFVKLL
jgi:hypothetical protein